LGAGQHANGTEDRINNRDPQRFPGMHHRFGVADVTRTLSGGRAIFAIFAAIFGSMVLIAWFIFLFNIVMSVGLKGLIGIFTPAKDSTASYGIEPEPEPAPVKA